MRKLIFASMIAASLSIPSFAQDSEETQETNSEAATGPSTSVAPLRPQVQPDYVHNVFESWAVKCSPALNNQCFLTQIILNETQEPLFEINVVPANVPEQPDAVAGITMITPLGALLPRGIFIDINDGQDVWNEPYQYCTNVGCHVRFAINQGKLDQLLAANKVIISMQHVRSGPNEIPIEVRTSGMTAAYEELMKLEAKAEEEGETSN